MMSNKALHSDAPAAFRWWGFPRALGAGSRQR